MELSAVDNRRAFISNIYLTSFYLRQGLKHFHHCDKSPFSLSWGSADPQTLPIDATERTKENKIER